MTQEMISIHHPQAIEKALAALKAGELIAFPTDTVYGLAANTFSEAAISRLFDAKGRDSMKAIAVLVGGVGQLDQVAQDLPEAAGRLAARFWPGALTLVVPKKAGLPAGLSPYPTIGVRMPDHEFALELLRATGPLATTSANRSGGENAVTAAEVVEQLGEQVALVLDGGTSPGGVPSTVVDCTGPTPRILRLGAISEESLFSNL